MSERGADDRRTAGSGGARSQGAGRLVVGSVSVGTDRHELVRLSNIEAVFRSISEAAPASRAEVMAATGLSKPTVLAVVAALADEGLIRVATARAPADGGLPEAFTDTERGNSDPAPTTVGPGDDDAGDSSSDASTATLPRTDGYRRPAGRIAVRYEPNPKAAYVVGIDVGGTKSHAAIADLSGEILAEADEPTTQRGAQAVLRQLDGLARDVTRRAGVEWRDVGTVSLGTPGVENPDGSIGLADNVPGLDQLRLAAALSGGLGVPVLWENDVNVAAIGEHDAGAARGCSTFAMLSIGTGIGLGIMIAGQLARGARGAAGEVAYLPVGADPAEPPAFGRGAFELTTSGSGVTDLLHAELAGAGSAAGRATTLTAASTARDVYAAAARGDTLAATVVDRHAALLARGVLAIAAVLDPELIVLGGGIGSNPLLLQPLRSAIDLVSPFPIRVETSSLGARAGVVGAVHRGLRSLPTIRADRVSARLAPAGRSSDVNGGPA